MTTSRRSFLTLLGGVGLAACARTARAQVGKGLDLADLRGSLDATSLGMRPDTIDDQSRLLDGIIRTASVERKAVFLPPGTYVLSGLDLPEFVHLTGVRGATRLVYGGAGTFLSASDATHIQLSNLIIDGANRWLADHAQAALQISRTPRVMIDDCDILGSRKHAVFLEACGGRISRSTISGAGQAAIYSVQANGLRIEDNDIADCANGGVLVHRWQIGSDGSMVLGNRIARIGAHAGGTGQNGNGINVFRADHVLVSNNHIRECAFSAIRSNSGSDVQIIGNQCLASGETAIYSEFAFRGAIVANNLVDGAANGISIANFDHGGRLAAVSGNLIRNLSTQGPYQPDAPGFGTGIAAEADVAITGNVIEGAPLFGMMIGWGPYLRNVVVSGNLVRNGEVGIAVTVVDGAQAAHIANNVLQGQTRGAIVGYRWQQPVTGDLARQSAGGFPHLDVAHNSVS